MEACTGAPGAPTRNSGRVRQGTRAAATVMTDSCSSALWATPWMVLWVTAGRRAASGLRGSDDASPCPPAAGTLPKVTGARSQQELGVTAGPAHPWHEVLLTVGPALSWAALRPPPAGPSPHRLMVTGDLREQVGTHTLHARACTDMGLGTRPRARAHMEGCLGARFPAPSFHMHPSLREPRRLPELPPAAQRHQPSLGGRQEVIKGLGAAGLGEGREVTAGPGSPGQLWLQALNLSRVTPPPTPQGPRVVRGPSFPPFCPLLALSLS